MIYFSKKDVLGQFQGVIGNYIKSRGVLGFIVLKDVSIVNLHAFFEKCLIENKKIIGTIDVSDYVKLVDLLTEEEMGKMLWECFVYEIHAVRKDEDGDIHLGRPLMVSVGKIREENKEICFNYSANNIASIYCKPFFGNVTNEEIRDYSLRKEHESHVVMCDFKAKMINVYNNLDKLCELIDKKKKDIGELIGRRWQKIRVGVFFFIWAFLCFCIYNIGGGFVGGLIVSTMLMFIRLIVDWMTINSFNEEGGLKGALLSIRVIRIKRNKRHLKDLKLDFYRKKIEAWIEKGLDVKDIYEQYTRLQNSLIEVYELSEESKPSEKMKELLQEWLAFKLPIEKFYPQLIEVYKKSN